MKTKEISQSQQLGKDFSQVIEFFAGKNLLLGTYLEKVCAAIKPKILQHYNDLLKYQECMEKTHQEKIFSFTAPYVDRIANLMNGSVKYKKGKFIVDEEVVEESISGPWAEINEIVNREKPRHLINLCEAEVIFMERVKETLKGAEPALAEVFCLSLVPQFDPGIN